MKGKERIDKLRILIAPLDWGLGHATRCIPIIRELLRQNCEVLIAADGPVKTLLVAEFPQLSVIPLPGYRIQYAAGKWRLLLKIAAQIPKILSAIRTEHRWLSSICEQYAIDAIVSDNRYGLYNQKAYAVFLTHQLRIKSPLGKASEWALQRINYSFISRYNECWVPDREGKKNLAGTLSHPAQLPAVPVRYIGPLSRFSPQQPHMGKHLLVLLSGPEPQRTVLEQLLLSQLTHYSQPVLFIRGLPGAKGMPAVPKHITIHNHQPAGALEASIREATFVIARCGYSTVMDVMTLGKKSILIPTPGQTEQEYLAQHLLQQQYALCLSQKNFQLNKAVQAARHFAYRPFPFCGSEYLEQSVRQLISRLSVPTPVQYTNCP